MSEPYDSLNTAILESRRQLHELQEALQKPDIDYTQVLEQISQTTEKIKSEADTISEIRYNESTVLPITQPKKPPTMIEQIRAVSPKEYTPYHSTKAYELKRKYAKPAVPVNKPLPRLSAAQKQLPAVELLKRGLVSETDDLSELMPQVAGNQPIKKSTLFNGIAYDFKGAAEASRRRREEKRLNEEKFIQQMEKVSEKKITDQNSQISAEPPLTPTEPAKKKDVPNPRIYEELQDEFAYQTLLVVRGKVARETPDFESFQRTNATKFKSIENVLNAIESYCAVFGITYAEIDGRRLSETADFSGNLTHDHVAKCLIGTEEQVANAKLRAANLIKFNWKVWKWRKDVEYRKQLFRAAYKIQMAWRMNKVRRMIMAECRRRIEAVENSADELRETIIGKYSSMEKDPHVLVHVITNFQDLQRVLDLMYSNVSIILLMSELPPGHIWEDFIEFMGCCGIPNVNERVNYVVMRDLRTGNNTSNRLLCDMRSINQVRRLIASRNCFLIPHSDWHSERRLSVDIKCPIFGCVNTNSLQGRNSVRDIFREADVVSSISTRECRDYDELCANLSGLILDNRDITRWILHLGFTASDDAIAWFDTTPEFYTNNADFSDLIKKNLHAKQGAKQFIQMIPKLGATGEAVPTVVRSFASVCVIVTGTEIRVVGTYDRMHFQPFRFGASLVPAVSCNSQELIVKARQVATVLLKRGAIGHATIDFLVYSEENNPASIIGFDVRVNSYPASLNMAFLACCAGFDEKSGKMKLMKGVGDIYGRKSRFVVVHNGLTHPGMSMIGTKDLKAQMFSEGLIFDLLQRTGFKLLFLSAPVDGRNTAIASAVTPENALSLMEKAYTYMLKVLSPKSGGDLESSISSALIGMRHFKTRIFP